MAKILRNIDQIIDTQGNDLTAPVLSFRNKFINGNMQINQRGNGTASAGTFTYTTDRWYIYCVGAGCSYSQVDTSTGKALEVIPDLGTTNQIIAQKIENVNCFNLAEQTVTISGRVYIDDATGVTFNTNIYSASSTNASYGSTRTFSSNLTSGEYTYFSEQVTLPADAKNGVEVDFSFLNAGDRTIRVTDLQFEEGTVPTPFEHRPLSIELALCQRYYQKSYDIETVPGTDVTASYIGLHTGNGVTDTATNQNVPFTIHVNPTMRTQPTFYYYSLEGTLNRYNTFTAGAMTRSETATTLGGFWRGVNTISGYTAPGGGQSYGFCYVLTAEL